VQTLHFLLPTLCLLLLDLLWPHLLHLCLPLTASLLPTVLLVLMVLWMRLCLLLRMTLLLWPQTPLPPSAAAPDAVVLVPDDAVDDALEGGDCRKLFRMQWCKT